MDIFGRVYTMNEAHLAMAQSMKFDRVKDRIWNVGDELINQATGARKDHFVEFQVKLHMALNDM